MPRILLIEPEGAEKSDLEQVLDRPGWALRKAAEIGAVESALAGELPDLVVLDLATDGGRGVEICHLIRSTGGADLLPGLMVGTGREGVRNFGDALVEGGDYYFERPLDSARLIAKIGAYVGGLSEEPTLVSAPPPASLGHRVERMLDLGTAFRDGLHAPQPPAPEQPLETDLEREPTLRTQPQPPASLPVEAKPAVSETAPPSQKASPTGSQKQEDLETIMSQLAEELAEMSDDSTDGLANEARAWGEIENRLLAREPGKPASAAEEEQARRDAEEKARQAAAEKARQAAEEKARLEIEEKVKQLAEEKTRREAEEKSRREAEEKARREAEEKARREAGEKARREAEEKARREAEEQARREAEEQARREAGEKARREAEEKARREADADRIRQEKAFRARLKAESMQYRANDRLLRFELRQQVIKAEQQKAKRHAAWSAAKQQIDSGQKAEPRQRPVGLDEGFLQEEIIEAEQIWAEAAEEGLQELEPARTRGGGDKLIQLLEREATLAREKVLPDEFEPEVDDGVPTAPHLPPRPGEDAPEVVSLEKIRQATEEPDEFEKEKTEDLLPIARRRPDVPEDEEPETRGRVERRKKPPEAPGRLADDRSLAGDWEETQAGESVFVEPPRPRPSPPDPPESQLERESVPWVLWRLYLQKTTGAVRFRSGSDSKTVFFEAGVPVGVHSNQGADRLEEMLLRESLIDRVAYAEARLKNLVQPRALAAHLVERGVLRPEELFPLVRRHFAECLIGLFEWQEGTATWAEGSAPEGEKVHLDRHVAWLVCEGIRRKFTLDRMMRELGSPASLLAPTSEGGRAVGAGQMGLLAAERKVLGLVNGNRPIEEVVFLSGQPEELVFRILLAAVVVGLLVVTARGLRGGPEDPEEHLRSSLAIARRRLEAKFAQINQASYFEMLGLSPSATAYEIELAFRKLSGEFHPANYSHPQLADLADKLQVVRLALEDAREVLSDDLLREGYRRSLAEE